MKLLIFLFLVAYATASLDDEAIDSGSPVHPYIQAVQRNSDLLRQGDECTADRACRCPYGEIGFCSEYRCYCLKDNLPRM